MLKEIRPAIVMILGFSLLTGFIYPMVTTGIAGLVFPHQAAGSLVEQDGKVIGSTLIGQNFVDEKYFHPRPSATTDTDPADSTKTVPAPYNAANSSGSNLGPTAKALSDRVHDDVAKLQAENPGVPIPGDLVTSSGSGLDPDISPEAAHFQALRIARVRKMPVAAVNALVDANTEARTLGLIGEPRVNVLRLNMALDNAASATSK